METIEERLVRLEVQVANLYGIIKWQGTVFGTVISGLLIAILTTLVRR